MYEAIGIAVSGLMSQQRRMDTIADNVSNTNTVGYKAARVDFKEALYTAGYGPAPAYTPEADQQKGHGVMTAQIAKTFTTGSFMTTGVDLDFAMNGEGFFEVQDSDGRLLYTRAGNFYKSLTENGTALVDANGYNVMNDAGEPIVVPDGTTTVGVAEDGTISFIGADGTTISTVKLGIYTFTNKTGLSAVGGTLFAETDMSGEKLPAENPVLRQFVLEGSNVNMGDEMTKLIRTQRMFSLASRALTTADQMEGIANSMRR